MCFVESLWRGWTLTHNKTRELLVRHYVTREIAKRFDVTGWPERKVERLERGLLMQIDTNYFVDDTAISEEVTDEPTT